MPVSAFCWGRLGVAASGQQIGRVLTASGNLLLAARGVKGAALAACVENVDFLDVCCCCWVDGVNDGDSTLNDFFGPLGRELGAAFKRPVSGACMNK